MFILTVMTTLTKVHIILAFLLHLTAFARAQGILDSAKVETSQLVNELSVTVADTLPELSNTIPSRLQPSPNGLKPINWDEVSLSEDAPEEDITYSSKDSMFFDLKNKQIHLYGNAKVDYQSVNLTAHYILIDWDKSEMIAEGKKTKYGWIGKPNFKQGGQDVKASKIRYNFKTYKGIIYDVQTFQEGMNVVGTKGKFIGAGNDTTKANVVYNRDAIFSSCDLDVPHFGIRSNKQKIVQDKVAVVGPSNIEIGGIPTPLWLPFGFFPISPGKRTGLLFPGGYEYSERWGFGLEGVGWYFPFSDKMDLQLRSDIYLKGTFRVHALSNYRKRYKYNGNANVSFAYLRSEVEGQSVFTPSLSLRWSHNQDAKAHPYRSLSGSVNIQTSNFQQTNRPDAQSQFQTSLSSNMAYRQKFDQPFDLSVNFRHSQNTNTRDVTINFPTVNFQTQALFPFKRKLQTGGEKWFERVQLRYTGEAKNQFMAKDTTLFTQQTLNDAEFGARHNVDMSTSFNLLKHFNFTPRATYKEVWYFESLERTFDPTLVIETDTVFNPSDTTGTDFLVNRDTTFGTVNDFDNFGFTPFRQYNLGISMNTRIFGTFLFKSKKVKGFRHVISPTISFNFTPDYTNPDWGYFKSVQTDLREEEEQLYSIFQNNSLGFDRPSQSGRQMNISYSFGNQFELKVFNKKQKKDKIIKLLRSFSVGGNYNFAADSLNWSDVRISGNQSFLNGMTTWRFGIDYSPYARNDKTGGRINDFYLDTNGKLLRLDGWNSTVTTQLSVKRIRDLFNGISTDVSDANRSGGPGGNNGQEEKKEEDFLSLFEGFNINHSLTVRRDFFTAIQKDSVALTANSISTRGSIQLTPTWRINVGNIGYDFVNKRITYPDFSFYRDLHCWEMGLSWQPFFQTYGFFIRVKPGHLGFINIPYDKRIQDRR